MASGAPTGQPLTTAQVDEGKAAGGEVTLMTGITVEVLGTIRQGEFTPARPAVATVLTDEEFLIGSRPGATPSLTLRDGTVSRRHARITRQGGTWHIQDLDSDNGMVVLRGPVDFTRPAPSTALVHERVQKLTITQSATLALGAVVIRLTAEGQPAS
jgi:pSer/pThr/pTyr-binding forkhead associated (FHA) protein